VTGKGFQIMDKLSLRHATQDDAQATLDLQRDVISENEFLILTPKEFNRTLDDQMKWINKINENDREVIIIAELEDKLVGLIVFQVNPRIKMQHSGSFGLIVKKQHRGTGIGRKLIQALLDWASQNPKIEKVCLGVFANNTFALSLYKSMGFIEEGRKIREFKISDEEYIDVILMYKLV